jgi:ribosomal protein S18 acetylase RimI-like enzyme
MTDTVSIRSARATEAPALGRLIAVAFSHLPTTKWLVPDDDARVDVLAGQFTMFVEQGIAHGDVYVAGDGVGVAVWLPPGDLPDIEDYDERLAARCGPYTPRIVALDEVMHKARPVEPEHAYLAMLAVHEPARDLGVGSALLNLQHRRLDADGTPAYLDASGLHSRRLYQRHGYTDYAPPYGVGGIDGFYPMWREPK